MKELHKQLKYNASDATSSAITAVHFSTIAKSLDNASLQQQYNADASYYISQAAAQYATAANNFNICIVMQQNLKRSLRNKQQQQMK